MTIDEMHSRVDQWLDTASSPRFPWDQKDTAINTAIDSTVNDRYYPYDPKERERAFQTVQRIRDELYTLIVPSTLIPVSGTEIIPLSGLKDYRFLLSMSVVISNEYFPTTPTSYDELESDLLEDPFKRPTLDYPSRVYRVEDKDGIHIKWGGVGALSGGLIVYLKDPRKVNFQTKVNCDLPKNLHEEICRMAAEILKNQTVNLNHSKQS